MRKITIIGAGLVGSLTALFQAEKGYQVEIFEKRSDPRKRNLLVGEGRSINLAISVRGLHALSLLGLDQEVLKHAVPMRGRMMHSTDGLETFQPYGTSDKDAINSLSRGWLNGFLMDKAEKSGQVKIHFQKELSSVDFKSKSLVWKDGTSVNYDFLLGTDGSASVIRQTMQNEKMTEVSSIELSHSYKEFVMLPIAGQPQMKTEALHIWPRGNFMVIALPNIDGGFTCTLFLPTKGLQSFETLTTPAEVEKFFTTHFLDFTRMVPDFVDQFFDNPAGKMFTVKTDKWTPAQYDKEVLLIGDSVHAIVPFFGQGMNCGFEDSELLMKDFDQLLETGFSDYASERKPNTDAIADMAVENFVEMSDKVGDPNFLFQKLVEKKIQETYPNDYISRYSLVSFSRVPYKHALAVGEIQKDILDQVCKNRSRLDEVSLTEAKILIDQRLAPVLQKLTKEHKWT